MERTRFRRPEIQKRPHTKPAAFGNDFTPVPKAVMPRPGGLAVQRAMSMDVVSPKPVPAPLTETATEVSEQQHGPSAAVLARRVPIDMDLPGEQSPLRVFKKGHWRQARRLAFRTVAVAVVLVITLGGLLFSQSYLKLHKTFRGTAGTAAALNPNVQPDLLKGEGRGRINILLLGRGGGTHDAPDLTDTMMIASVDPVNHTTTLLSIPRDLWVNVPGHGVMKINAAWEMGEFGYLHKTTPGSTNPKAIQAGFDLLDQTLQPILGIEIDYHMLVNFQAFKQAVDTVGGVNINVPTDLVDPTMAWENHNNPVLAKAGQQVFDGTQALIYARSRETSSDFARAERQRSLILALKGKVVTLGTLSNPLKISNLVNAFGDNVQTDLSLSNANRLYGLIKGVGDNNVNSIGLANAQGDNKLVTTGNIGGQSVVLPKAGLYKYDDIQQFVRGQLKDPYILKENAKILVLNGTTTAGLATAKSDELKTYGYNVIGAANAPTSGWYQSKLVDLTHRNKYTRNYLEKRFRVKADTSLSDKTINTNGADFVIIIGSDETSPAQYQAN
jgi:LCP family protein required for cell wall assembly